MGVSLDPIPTYYRRPPMPAETDRLPVEVPTPLPARPAEDPADPHLVVIEPRTGFTLADLKELWRYRELFGNLLLRELMSRYKQTILGVGWSLFQPLSTVAVFVLFLGRMGRTDVGVENYTLFVLLGVLPWTYFGQSVLNAGNSLVANERLITKVYFPRLLIPLSAVGAATVDFMVGLLVAAGFLAYYRVAPGWSVLFLPGLVLLLGLAATGCGVLISALIVAQRDFRYLLLFGMQLWMFATPCIYLPMTAVGPTGHALVPLNPAYGLILAFRGCVLGTPFGPNEWYALSVSSAVGLLLLAAGLLYFRKVERTFADTI